LLDVEKVYVPVVGAVNANFVGAPATTDTVREPVLIAVMALAVVAACQTAYSVMPAFDV
jgi:hypothetical protein